MPEEWSLEWLAVPAVGTSAAVLLTIAVAVWIRRTRRHRARLVGFEPRILITGSRGKSSTVRLVHAALKGAGRRPWARVTGTVTEEIAPDGRVLGIRRHGQASILELLGTVDRAARGGADSLIVECMAVAPALIDTVQTVYVQADIAVVTNVRADHLEEEGSDLEEIAGALALASQGAQVLITADDDPQLVESLRRRAEFHGARFVHADARVLDASVVAALGGEHPDNVAIVLAIAEELGIARDTAVAGMRTSTHEPNAVDPITHRALSGDTTVVFAALGSINDPQSTRAAIENLKLLTTDFPHRVAIVASRWDRPLRSIEFGGLLRPDEFDAVLLAGPLFHPIRRALIRSGWERHRIHRLRWMDLVTDRSLLERIVTVSGRTDAVLAVSMANVKVAQLRRLEAVLTPYRDADEQIERTGVSEP